MKKLINSIQESIQALQKGEFIILCDDEDRENEGDLVIAGDKVTPEKLNFMIKHTGGVLTVPMKEEFLKKLDLPLMCKENTGPQGTAFTISVDYLEGTTTGISCHDRYLTIKALANPKSLAADFGRPGHIFPLKYTPGGVLKRTGHTEASIDLLEMADLFPVAVISELVNENGEMTRGEDLKNFAELIFIILGKAS